MKLSFSTLGCPRWTFQDIVATAYDLGYEGIEVRGIGKDISVPSVPQFGESQLDATRKQLDQLGLRVCCLASDCCLHIASRREEVAREARAYIDLAARLGTPYVRVMGADAVPHVTGEVDDALVLSALRDMLPYAAQKNVTLIFETHGVWADSARLARLLAAADSRYVGALWDIHHPFRFFGETPERTIGNLAPYIRHVHVKDARLEQGRSRYVMLGTGELPVLDALSRLAKLGYEGYYSLEWMKRWDDTLEDPGIAFAHYVNFMRSLP